MVSWCQHLLGFCGVNTNTVLVLCLIAKESFYCTYIYPYIYRSTTLVYGAYVSIFHMLRITYKSMYMCIYIYLYHHIYIHVHACIIYVYMHVYACIWIYIHMYLHTHTYVYMDITFRRLLLETASASLQNHEANFVYFVHSLII